MKSNEFKALVDTFSNVVNARAATTQALVKAEIKASETRVTRRINEAKEELRAELATKEQVANLGIAIHQVDTNLVKKVNKHERRLENLEDSTKTNDPHKNYPIAEIPRPRKSFPENWLIVYPLPASSQHNHTSRDLTSLFSKHVV